MIPTTSSDVDPSLWRAAAASSIRIPTLGSRVFYFPQGHFEQCLSSATTTTTSSASATSAPPEFTSPPPAFFLCRVVSVRFLCHPVTDQAFARIHLVPITFGGAEFSSGGAYVSNVEVEDEDDVVSFTKILTPSDANNGGGFSVPRFCADSIFPPLDFEADPPVQNLVMRDLHGSSYAFRHIYRGTPRRHLLTTGWSKFVNSKKLVAGDSVVFMRRRRTGELYAGLRRAVRGEEVSEGWNCNVKSVRIEKSKEDEWGVSKGVGVDAVLESLEKAVRGMAFEVVFYPRPGWSEFIVGADEVEKAILGVWTAGMRVKMPMETEDSTRTTWYQGTVSSATVPDCGPWRGSPWRMLQITWDEPELLQHVNRVNPWQVEHIVSTSLHAAFPPTKKIKAWEDPILVHNRGELTFSMTSFSNSSMGPLTPSYSDHTFFPAGMQGARQIQDCGSFLSEFLKNGIDKMNSEDVMDNNMQLKLETLSTELNIGSFPSDTSSVDNSNSFNGTELERKQDYSPKVGKRSFQLFGKIIGMEQPADGSGGNEECSSRTTISRSVTINL